MKVFIIGSVSNEERIKEAADKYRELGFEVDHVKKIPENEDITFLALVIKCFDNILDSDIVVVVTKDDGTIGEGVTYEFLFSKYIGKPCIIYGKGINHEQQL